MSHTHVHIQWPVDPPDWAAKISSTQAIIITKLEKIMVNIDALIAASARLKADDDKLLAFLQTLRDQNVQLAAELAGLSSGDPTVQAGIDAAVKTLTDTATAVENILPPAPPAWTAGATVAAGDKVTLSGGAVLTATVAGTTGTAEPAAPAAGATVVDGGVTWTL